jgi:hypothetical protein
VANHHRDAGAGETAAIIDHSIRPAVNPTEMVNDTGVIHLADLETTMYQ